MKRRRFGTAARATGIALATIGAASTAYQTLSEMRSRRQFPPPGRLVDVQGRQLHVWCEGKGSPAIVVIPALGAHCLGWVRIQRELTADAQVCLYDRGGLGWSSYVPGRRSLGVLADELNNVLLAAKIPPPYVFVGHSIGGLIARMYVARHPGRAAGLVLVDPSHEQMWARRREVLGWREGSYAMWKQAVKLRIRPLGLTRVEQGLGLSRSWRRAAERRYPSDLLDAGLAVDLTSHQRRTDIREMIDLDRGLKEAAAERTHLGDLPLIVLTSSRHDPNSPPGSRADRRRQHWYDDWLELQKDQVALSRNSTHWIAEASGHYIHLDQPDLVLNAIREMCRDLPDGRGSDAPDH